jgi:hypothetical protein
MSEEISKYCKLGYRISYDQTLAELYLPIMYDPYQYGRDYNPALYFRIVESNAEKCIQYFYYWDKQDCKKDYVISEPNTIGSLAILQGPGDTFLRRQQTRCQGLTGVFWINSGFEACRPVSRTPMKALRPSQKPISPATSRRSMSRPWLCMAMMTRSFQSRTLQ